MFNNLQYVIYFFNNYKKLQSNKYKISEDSTIIF